MVRETDMVGSEEVLGRLMLGIGMVGDRVKRLLEIEETGDKLRACCRKKAWLELKRLSKSKVCCGLMKTKGDSGVGLYGQV
jgi:hypothetical protein